MENIYIFLLLLVPLSATCLRVPESGDKVDIRFFKKAEKICKDLTEEDEKTPPLPNKRHFCLFQDNNGSLQGRELVRLDQIKDRGVMVQFIGEIAQAPSYNREEIDFKEEYKRTQIQIFPFSVVHFKMEQGHLLPTVKGCVVRICYGLSDWLTDDKLYGFYMDYMRGDDLFFMTVWYRQTNNQWAEGFEVFKGGVPPERLDAAKKEYYEVFDFHYLTEALAGDSTKRYLPMPAPYL